MIMIGEHMKTRLLKLGNNLPLVILLAVAIVSAGCDGGSATDDGPARTGVSGKVTYNGSPAGGATVTFHPVADTGGKAASGLADEDGQFQMGTLAAGDGVIPGDYDVTVTKIEAAGSGNQASEDDPNYDPDAGQDAEPSNSLPAKYADPSTSELKVNVKSEQAISDLKFELAD
jgi:hypothetical protein